MGAGVRRALLVPVAWCGPVLALVDVREFESLVLTGLSSSGCHFPRAVGSELSLKPVYLRRACGVCK